MITNGMFGDRHGRLGNQIFQLAVLHAIRARRGHEYWVTREGASIWQTFDLDVASAGPACEHRHHELEWASIVYDPQVFEQPDGTEFHGYFQSWRYLDDVRGELPGLFRFRNEHRARAEALLFAHRRRYRRPLVSLHVRRGDYVDPDLVGRWGDLVAGGYHRRAIEAIGPDPLYLVFSDDIEWCRQTFELECAEFVDEDASVSLCMMTECDVKVIANSSFSWWGAYLDPQAEVYAPARWFGPDMRPPNDRSDDIVHPSWRTLPVDWPPTRAVQPNG
ncbi:MAG: alpha-1,2-fucosyltransferase [Acidimicrobiales bacterium]